MENIIEKLFQEIENTFPEYKKTLEKGYIQEEISFFEKKLDFLLPQTYKQLLKHLSEDFNIAFGWSFTPLERSIHLANEELNYSNGKPSNSKKVKSTHNPKKRLSIIEDYGGSAIFLDFDAVNEQDNGQLILILRDYPENFFLIAKNLEEFIEKIIIEFQQKRVELKNDYFSFSCHNDYRFWIDLSIQQDESIETDTNEIEIGEIWGKSIKENEDFYEYSPTSIKKSDLKKIKYLNIFPENFNNLEMINLFPNIIKVYISAKDTIIPDKIWTLLSEFEGLEVDINTDFFDIKNLLNLKKLLNLHIFSNQLENMQYFSELNSLETLSLSNLENLDFSFLEKLENLKVLEIKSSLTAIKRTTKIINLDKLALLKNLSSLELHYTDFNDFKILKQLPKLSFLCLVENKNVDYNEFSLIKKKLKISCDWIFFENTVHTVVEIGHTYSSLRGQPTREQKSLYDQYNKGLLSKKK